MAKLLLWALDEQCAREHLERGIRTSEQRQAYQRVQDAPGCFSVGRAQVLLRLCGGDHSPHSFTAKLGH